MCQKSGTELEFKAEQILNENSDHGMSLKLNLSERARLVVISLEYMYSDALECQGS